MENKTTITVNKDTWKKLAQLKLDLNAKDFDGVVSYLLLKSEGIKNEL